MSDIGIADVIGILGAALIVVAYFRLQIGRLDPASLHYSVANSLGALGIIYSLYYEFNLSAFVIEFFWLVISLYGVFRTLRLRKSLPYDAVVTKDD